MYCIVLQLVFSAAEGGLQVVKMHRELSKEGLGTSCEELCKRPAEEAEGAHMQHLCQKSEDNSGQAAALEALA